MKKPSRGRRRISMFSDLAEKGKYTQKEPKTGKSARN